MTRKFKEKEWWITTNNQIVQITQITPTTDIEAAGRCNVYNIGQTEFKQMKYSAWFTEYWLNTKVTKETHPEYFL